MFTANQVTFFYKNVDLKSFKKVRHKSIPISIFFNNFVHNLKCYFVSWFMVKGSDLQSQEVLIIKIMFLFVKPKSLQYNFEECFLFVCWTKRRKYKGSIIVFLSLVVLSLILVAGECCCEWAAADGRQHEPPGAGGPQRQSGDRPRPLPVHAGSFSLLLKLWGVRERI